jgi:hypothetical protein
MVLDVTRAGAGLVVLGGAPLRESDPIVIEIVKMGSTAVMLTLRGTVRDVGKTSSGDEFRVGVSLTFNGPHEQRIAQTLFSE